MPNNTKAYTLIELMVSISIISIVTTSAVVSFRSFKSSSELNATVHNTVADLRRVLAEAISLKNTPSGYPPAGGWGVRIRNQDEFYYIFPDINGDGFMNGGAETNSATRIDFQGSYKVPARITIDGIDRNFGQFIFEPPWPIVHINGGNNANGVDIVDGDEAWIEIEDTITHDSMIIHINKYGLVEVN